MSASTKGDPQQVHFLVARLLQMGGAVFAFSQSARMQLSLLATSPSLAAEGERRAGFGKVLDAALSRSVEAAPLEVRVSAAWSAMESVSFVH